MAARAPACSSGRRTSAGDRRCGRCGATGSSTTARSNPHRQWGGRAPIGTPADDTLAAYIALYRDKHVSTVRPGTAANINRELEHMQDAWHGRTLRSKVTPAIRPWTLHDLRRSFASGLQRLGVAPHIVELALNHRSGTFSGVAGIYQRHRYAKEVREAFELCSQHIDALVTPKATAAA